MSDPQYELAIFGSTPLAGLLAGLLAAEHRKRVVLVAETPSPFRLPPGFDLSVAPITRPESWALLKAGTAETLKLLRQMRAHHAVRRVDPVFVAETPASEAALSHVRMMAVGFGFAAERLPYPDPAGQTATRIRDAVLLDRSALAPVLSVWLDRVGVVRLEARSAKAVIGRDGGVRIDHLGQTIEATHAVLADDEAILTQLGAGLDEVWLAPQPSTVILMATTRRLAAPFVLHLDRDVTLVQQHDGQMLAFGAGGPDEAMRRAGRCFAGNAPLRRLAQRQFRAVTPADGAPLVGPVRGGKATLLAGLGPGGIFLAPALARFLAGTSSSTEGAYFAARQAVGADRSTVGDYTASAVLEALP